MTVRMSMLVNSKVSADLVAKEVFVGVVIVDFLRGAAAAKMLIQTQHSVGGCHDQMQIMRYQNEGTAMLFGIVAEQFVKMNAGINVQAAIRFIQNQEFRAVEQGSCQQNQLCLPAGKIL